MHSLTTICESPRFTQLWETHFAKVLSTRFEKKGLSADVLKLTTTQNKSYLVKLSCKSADYLHHRHELLCATHPDSTLLPVTFSGIPYLGLNAEILEVYPYIEGKTLNHHPSYQPVIEQLGKQIAILHWQLPSVDSFATGSLKLIPRSFEQLAHEINAAQTMVLQNGSAKQTLADEYLMAVRSLYPHSASLCSGLQKKIDNLSTQQLIHGDLHGNNIIIDINNRLHLIDFDKMMLGPKVFDLAKLIACSLFSDSGEIDKKQVKALLVGYQSQAVITVSEQKLLLPMILGLLTNGTWLLKKYLAETEKVSDLLRQNTQKIKLIVNDFSDFQAFFEHDLF